MSAQDNVAIIALVVSLIALVIALGQLAQQLLGTAEGYRRCAEPIVGVWHRLRWRKFIWSELRYETHFITPRFLMHAEGDPEDQGVGMICFRDIDQDLKPTPMPLTWFPRKRRKFAIAEAPAILSSSAGRYMVEGEASSNKDESQNYDSASSPSGPGDLVVNISDEKSGSNDSVESRTRHVVAPRTRILFRSENKASWLLLLERMHFTYKSYQHGKLPTTTYQAVQWTQDADNSTESRQEADNTASIEGGIQFEEWVWDTMPPDVSKPLATTTLGTLISFSLRLGMQWRTLSGVRSDQLLCEGEGFAITFIEMPSVGLVAKFRDTGRLKRGPIPQLTPGRATEKLMFGIIPGAKYLVDQDISCVRDDREVHVMSEVCRYICRDWKLYDLRNDKKQYWEPKNEVITFLCEFLPISGSQCTTHYFWGWDPSRQSVLRYWEGRFAIWRHLKHLEDDGELRDDTLKAKTLGTICKHLTYLQDTYRNDLFAMNDQLAAEGADTSTGDPWQMQADLIHDCRTIFDWTTNWFREHGFSKVGRRDDGSRFRTLYMHLVAAHLWMATNCFDKAKEISRHNRKRPKWHDRDTKNEVYELNDKHYGVPHGIRYNFFDQHLYNIAETYIKFLTHDKYGVTKYMRDFDFGLSDDVVEVAWWVMILRGIVWTLPTIDDTRGEAIPSSYYENDTPVWIT